MASNRKKGERFAKLPVELLKDPAVTTLPHAAFRVLAIFAAGYKGDNNGTLACTDTWMRQFGMVSRDTLYAAIHQLLERGLIEVTRPGIKHRKVATLYAITWQELNYRDGQILGRFRPASHAYKQWKAPERTKKKVPDRRKATTPTHRDGDAEGAADTAEFQSDGRTSLSPMVGLEKSVFSPISPTKEGGFQSDGREYSKTLGGIHPGPVPLSHAHSPLNPSSESARALPKKNGGTDSKKDERLSKAKNQNIKFTDMTDDQLGAYLRKLCAAGINTMPDILKLLGNYDGITPERVQTLIQRFDGMPA